MLDAMAYCRESNDIGVVVLTGIGTSTGTYTKVLFGKATTDGTSDYVRLNDNEDTVYIIDGALSDLMEIPVYDMCRLPSLPVLEESRIRSIIIHGAAQDV